MKKLSCLLLIAAILIGLSACAEPIGLWDSATAYEPYMVKDALYYVPVFDTLDTHEKIGAWMNSHIWFGGNPPITNPCTSPRKTVANGYGDYLDLSKLYVNIAYFGMGIEMSICYNDPTTVEGRSVPIYRGTAYDVYSGERTLSQYENVALYGFNTLFQR